MFLPPNESFVSMLALLTVDKRAYLRAALITNQQMSNVTLSSVDFSVYTILNIKISIPRKFRVYIYIL